MSNSDRPARLRRSARFRLSPRGEATTSAYRAAVKLVRRRGRAAFDQALLDWSSSHGLELDDGLYLAELAKKQLSLDELGETLAVCGQSRGRVMEVIRRLLSRGFIEMPVAGTAPSSEPVIARAERERVVAEAEFDYLRLQAQPTPVADRRVIDGPLREAVHRLIAAQRFLVTLS